MLIAKIPVHVFVDGRREIIDAGDEVTGLHPHDARALIASGAIEDTEASARRRAKAEDAAAASLDAFLGARDAAIAQRESTRTSAPAGGDELAPGDAAAATTGTTLPVDPSPPDDGASDAGKVDAAAGKTTVARKPRAR